MITDWQITKITDYKLQIADLRFMICEIYKLLTA